MPPAHTHAHVRARVRSNAQEVTKFNRECSVIRGKVITNRGRSILLRWFDIWLSQSENTSWKPRDLESAIHLAMHQQNVRQRLARGSYITNSVQNDNYRHTSSRFDTTKPFLSERLGNFSQIETRNEEPIEPIEINYARDNRCFKCKKTGQRARFCPQNKLQAMPCPPIE